MNQTKQRNIPICLTLAPDLLDFYDKLAAHEQTGRNKLIVTLLSQIRDTVLLGDNNESRMS